MKLGEKPVRAAKARTDNPRSDRRRRMCWPRACGLTGALIAPRSAALAQLPDPNVAEPHRIAVVLQAEGQLRRVRLVRRPGLVRGRSRQLLVVLHEHAVQEDGGARRALQGAVGFATRRV